MKRKKLARSRLQVTVDVTPEAIRALVAAHAGFFGAPTQLSTMTADTQRAFARAWIEVVVQSEVTRALEEIEPQQEEALTRATQGAA